MLTTRQMKLIVNMPRAENHIHIEGSIPWELAFELAEKNNIELPAKDIDSLRTWVMDKLDNGGLDGFMICDRAINAVCQTSDDYRDTVVALAKNANAQNVIYQELHLDYPLNAERGIALVTNTA